MSTITNPTTTTTTNNNNPTTSTNSNSNNAIILSSDMPEELQNDVVRAAKNALEQFVQHKDRAQSIKKFLDKNRGPGKWHVVVGFDFGSYVTHQTGTFCFLGIDGVTFLVFKA
jgi:dynein light chain LC8-type